MTRRDTDTGEGPIYTVAIPVHNKAPHLARCLASVFAQTEGRLEVVAVDDASTDESADVLAQFGSEPRLRVFHRTTPGPGGYAARNLAVEEARAPWIAFLDADDEWLPDHLARIEAVRTQSGDDVGCLFAGYDNLENGQPWRDPYSRLHGDGEPRQLDLSTYLESWLQLKDSPIWTSSTVVRADILRATGGFPAGRCIRGGDKDAWLKVLSRSHAVYVGEVGALYHRDADNRVARAMPADREHCICATVRDLLAEERRASVRRLLKRVANMETLGYAKLIARVRRPAPVVFRRFHILIGPLQFGLILCLWIWPGLPRSRIAYALRGMFRRRQPTGNPDACRSGSGC